jgi:hypothetical protein
MNMSENQLQSLKALSELQNLLLLVIGVPHLNQRHMTNQIEFKHSQVKYTEILQLYSTRSVENGYTRLEQENSILIRKYHQNTLPVESAPIFKFGGASSRTFFGRFSWPVCRALRSRESIVGQRFFALFTGMKCAFD